MTMREILFRGKTGCLWAYGHVRKLGNKIFMYEVDGYPAVVVEPDTVGQFTGLTDKNGTKVFEGDIIKGENILHTDRVVHRVVYFENGFYLFDEDGEGWHPEYVPLYEVIGNIHDNPELTEGE